MFNSKNRELDRKEGLILSSSEQVSPSGEQKVFEYVQRVREGEPLNKIFEGLPTVFRSGIAKKLLQDQTIPKEIRIRLEELGYVTDQTIEKETQNDPPSFGGGDISTSQEKTLSTEETENVIHEILPVEERVNLDGWAASYELAKIASNEGIDLSTFSREQYAEYAVEKNLAIDDNQLRASVWQRMSISPEDNIAKAREIRSSLSEDQKNTFNKFAYDIKERARTDNRYLQERVRVRQGTKDSDSWLFFGINESLPGNSSETHKGYLTFNDLSTFSPERFTAFLEALQKAGYNGDVKVFQDLESQAVRLNDQIVMHGASPEDVDLANDLAREFFGTELAAVEKGKDEVIKGENKSYSQVLAGDLKKKIQEQNRKSPD